MNETRCEVGRILLCGICLRDRAWSTADFFHSVRLLIAGSGGWTSWRDNQLQRKTTVPRLECKMQSLNALQGMNKIEHLQK